MSIFSDTITVYNQDGEKWNKTVIKGVQWRHGKVSVSAAKNVISEERIESITIDFSRNYGNMPYLPPKEYENQERKEEYWTLREGKDIIVLGSIDTELDSAASIRQMKLENEYVVTVNTVSDNRNRAKLKNIKVVAK